MAWIGSGHKAGGRALLFGLVSCAVFVGFAGLPAVSMASTAPVVDSESVAHLGEREATLEAQLDPGGLETKYEFWLQYRACQSSQGGSCDAIIVTQVGEGFVGALDTDARVTANLTDLQGGYSYTFFVYAQNSGGWTKGESREFTASNGGGGSLVNEPKPPPVAENKATLYESTISPGAEKSGAEAAAQILAQAQRERAEREARETQASQPEPIGPAAATAVCRVPALKGDSLARARAALMHDHCRVGRVTRPRKSQRKLVVVAQSRPDGARLPQGTSVALRLDP